MAAACGPREPMVKALTEKYGEVRTWAAVSGGSFVEFFENRQTRTFTVLATVAGGMTCIVVAGEEKEDAPLLKAPGKEI